MTIIQLLHQQLKRSYYYQEMKEVSAAASGMFAIWLIYSYGQTIIQWWSTKEGQFYTVFFMTGLVLALVIKLYYRIMVIKYYEKETKPGLFEERNTKSQTD